MAQNLRFFFPKHFMIGPCYVKQTVRPCKKKIIIFIGNTLGSKNNVLLKEKIYFYLQLHDKTI